MEVGARCFGGKGGFASCLDSLGCRLPSVKGGAVAVDEGDAIGDRLVSVGFVRYFRLGMDGSGMSRDVKVARKYMGSRRAQVGIERQGLVDLAGAMEVDVFGQTSVVGIEVMIIPLELGVGGALAIGP